MRKNLIFVLFLMGMISPLFSQDAKATYFENGVNSPWGVGIDYDLGFAQVLSMNIGFVGGINSQVNSLSSFGDIFFGELQIGLRVYMNKIDTWNGMFLNIVGRMGVQNIPFRPDASELIFNRENLFQYGFGVYIGYRWSRDLLKDMSGIPFRLILEPYIGWSLDSYAHPTSSTYHRFTIGLSFKMGFSSHFKSKKTLQAEEESRQAKEQENTEQQKAERAANKDRKILN
ncbi:MAG: hypothetical protein ACRCS8_05065 [Brevinema sp.]